MATPWIFTPSTFTPGLWSVLGFGPQGQGFTFDLMSATVVDQTATFLNITGTGIIRADGFDDTDGGSAVALLGMGLGVIEFIRRRVRLRA